MPPDSIILRHCALSSTRDGRSTNAHTHDSRESLLVHATRSYKTHKHFPFSGSEVARSPYLFFSSMRAASHVTSHVLGHSEPLTYWTTEYELASLQSRARHSRTGHRTQDHVPHQTHHTRERHLVRVSVRVGVRVRVRVWARARVRVRVRARVRAWLSASALGLEERVRDLDK